MNKYTIPHGDSTNKYTAESAYNPGTVDEARMSASEELVELHRAVLDRVNDLEERLRRDLSDIMLSEHPPSTGVNALVEQAEPEWPPLFSELRNVNRATAQVLDIIDTLLDRIVL